VLNESTGRLADTTLSPTFTRRGMSSAMSFNALPAILLDEAREVLRVGAEVALLLDEHVLALGAGLLE
jgi:hypothetical protein